MEFVTISVILCAWVVAFGALGGYVSVQVDRDPAEGLILGVLFGPLGVLVAALLPAQSYSVQHASDKTPLNRAEKEDMACREALAECFGETTR